MISTNSQNGGTLMKELGFKPGPECALKVENAIVDGQLANAEEAIMAFVQADMK